MLVRGLGDGLAVLAVAALIAGLGLPLAFAAAAPSRIPLLAVGVAYLAPWLGTGTFRVTARRLARLPRHLPMSLERIALNGVAVGTSVLVVASALSTQAQSLPLLGAVLGALASGALLHHRPARAGCQAQAGGAGHPGLAPLGSAEQDWFAIIGPMLNELEAAWQAGYEAPSGRPEGATIAVMGAWGSGKTSLLNAFHLDLLARARAPKLRRSYADLVVVRWSPWELHRPDEIVRHFAAALSSGINARWFVPNVERRARTHARAVTQLKGLPSPIAELADGVGSMIRDVDDIPVLSDAFRAPLEELFASLRDAAHCGAADYRGGILLLIDEIDRLEADELRAVLRCLGAAQHVPWLSIIITVEPARVLEALAARVGADSTTCEPGRLEEESAKFFHRTIYMRTPTVG